MSLCLAAALLAVYAWRAAQRAQASRRASQRAAFRASQTDAIYEAVLRYRIDHDLPQRHGKGMFFVIINGADPSDAFLRRFAREQYRVVKMSEAHTPEHRGPPIDIFDIQWISAQEVAVGSQSLYLPPRAPGQSPRGFGSASLYHLRYRNGRWQVMRSEQTMVI